MAKVSENLRRFRQDSGLTQEQVAQGLNMTRQAVSGYESGRIQPDLETLQKLADIYGVELTEIIYGKKQSESKLFKAQKIIAVSTIIVVLVLIFAEAFILWYIDRFYQVQPGTVSPAEMETLQMRWRMHDMRALAGKLSRSVFTFGSIIFFVLGFCHKEFIRLKTKLLWVGIMILATDLMVLPMMLTDPIFSVDYWFVPAEILIKLLLCLILSLLIDALRRRWIRKNKAARQQSNDSGISGGR